MEQSLKKVEEKLDKLLIDFNKQIQAIDDDVNGFHNQLINLGVSNPESKDLIEFVVLVNDRIELKQIQFEEVMKETVKSIIEHKKNIIDVSSKIISKVDEIDKRKPPTLWGMIFSKIKNLTDIKIILGITAVLTLMIMKIFFPEASEEVVKYLISVFL